MSMFRSPAEARTTSGSDALETMRAIAVLLLVTYHVIGSNAGAGLHQLYPAPLRIFADFLIDIRMPFFAFIAGYVYGLRPIARGRYRTFILGKFRRIYIPGAIAAALFAIAAVLFGTGSAPDPADAWRIFFFPYMHYWFLQAILVIFLIYGMIDMALGGRGSPALLAGACFLSFADPFVPGNPMSVNQAIYLAPFFLLGVVYIRFRTGFQRAARWLVPVCLIVVLASTAINFATMQETGRLSTDRQDLQSLAMGMSTCLMALLVLPVIPQFEKIGPYAFTIYLYHVFGTAGMRMLLNGMGVTSLTVHLLLGLAAGIALPVALHLMADATQPGRRWFLGKRA